MDYRCIHIIPSNYEGTEVPPYDGKKYSLKHPGINKAPLEYNRHPDCKPM